MNKGFRKMFWGFILVLLEIHLVFIDILPDPIGYFLIYSGILLLAKEYPIEQFAKKASILALILLVLSIPEMFISNTDINQMAYTFSFWMISRFLLSILKLILVFYIFNIMIEIARKNKLSQLVIKTENLFKFYMVVMIILEILTPMGLNFHSNLFKGFTFFIITFALLMQIVFLVYLRRYSRLEVE